MAPQHRKHRGEMCDNKSAPAGATNTLRGLTRSSGTSREGLAMKATRKDARGGLRLPPAIDRLRSSLVEQDSGCTVRLTNRDRKGYSRITVDGRQWLAHRLMWTSMNGPIPDGLVVCHACDNPPCCNPQHLFLGTVAANNRDMWAKGRGKLTPPAWRKVPLAERSVIERRLAAGESKAAIGRTYGVTGQAIGHLARRWAA